MLHPAVASDLLSREVAVAREAHGQRLASITLVGTVVLCQLKETGALIRFDGARYDAEALGLSVITSAGDVAPHEAWPAGLSHGNHPVYNRPFACIQGCAEYYTFPGHTNEQWDRHRDAIRLTNLLGHVLRKANQ
jgi:hypothetical protein